MLYLWDTLPSANLDGLLGRESFEKDRRDRRRANRTESEERERIFEEKERERIKGEAAASATTACES